MRLALLFVSLVACSSPTSTQRAPAGSGAAPESPGQGQPCPEGACAPGLRCVRYFGIAGPRGPAFTSCEIPCLGEGATCPEGQRCATIADGPGRVCRPRR